MRKSHHTEEQIAFALKQAELGAAVAEVCREVGISGATFFRWKQKCGGLGPSGLRRLKQLEEENNKLERPVADLSLDKAKLQEVSAKKVRRPVTGASSSSTCATRSGWANGGAAGRCASTAPRSATVAAAMTGHP